MNDEIVHCFERLGLSNYESKALCSLFSRHDSTAQQISDSAEIPVTKVYSTLSSLEKRGLIKSTLDRPKKYRPLDPEAVMGSIIKKRKESLVSMEKMGKKYLKELRTVNNNGSKYEGAEKIWYNSTEEGVWNDVLRFIKDCKKSLYILADFYLWDTGANNDRLVEEMLKTPKDAKKYCIAPTDFNPSTTFPVLFLKMMERQDFTFRFVPENKIFHNFLIRDEENVGLSFKNPKTKKVTSGMVIRDSYIANGMTDYFNMIWRSAPKVEDRVRKEARKILEKEGT